MRSCGYAGPPHLAEQRAVAVVILINTQRFHAHATANAKGDRIDGRKTALQVIAVVARQTVEHHEQVEVTFRPGLAARLGTKKHDFA